MGAPDPSAGYQAVYNDRLARMNGTQDAAMKAHFAAELANIRQVISALSGGASSGTAAQPQPATDGMQQAALRQEMPSIQDPEIAQYQNEGPPPQTKSGETAKDEIEADDPAKVKAITGPTIAVNGGGPNSIVLENTTNKPMQLEFRRNNEPASAHTLVTLAPGQSVTASLPNDWAGNIRKLDGTNDYANLAEITFNGKGQLFFDESDETGRNASILMRTPGGQTAGSSKSILGDAPPGSFTYDAEGNKVLLPSKTNPEAFDWLTRQLGNTTVYIHSEDHGALRSDMTNTLTISFGAA
jgi:hypothetical protein